MSYLPDVMSESPSPALSNHRKGTTKSESGTHSADSNTTDSGKENNRRDKKGGKEEDWQEGKCCQFSNLLNI